MTTIPTGTWNIDPERSRVTFQVKHLGFANAKGRFERFAGRLELTDDPATAQASGTVEVASIETGDASRNEYLTSPDFFDAARSPQITFASTELHRVDDARLRVSGELGIGGVTRPVTLDAVVTGVETDPAGGERATLEVTGEVRRTDFELKIDGPSNALIGDRVSIALALSAVRAA